MKNEFLTPILKNTLNLKLELIAILFLLTFLFSCSSLTPENEDPLILPPNFDELPDLNKPKNSKKEPIDKEILELKELLLKN